ncbi:isopeptide-forming domain-containing fimbrial protein [uncultured Catenibacterium sp.]|uniref:isopeptide-forming domain-containing fimbrial protein n=1 Tax=uncultured Catenibacterium sp. TaxID=286142 RepID=UPI0025881AA0|nr:isopeptide-forming domain-containing fimbrial protein [uncultured Catenibacterium sp.]
MKLFKKLASFILAFAMVMAIAMPSVVMAADNGSITITGAKAGHTFEAYQIFTGKVSGNTLSNIEWGNGVSDEGKTKLGDAKEKAKTLNDSNSKDFAYTVSGYLTTPAASANTQDASGNYVISGLEPGYYLVKDKGPITGQDSYTKFILQVVGDKTVAVKKQVPESYKKVKDTNDTTGKTTDWQDSADWDIGDKVPFQLTGTVASDYKEYKAAYQLVFHDTLSAGLTFDASSIKVYKNEETTPIDPSQYTLTYPATDGHTFDVTIKNVKDLDGTVTKIRVEYEATLNENAVIGSKGNPNKMHMQFSNNPNSSQGGEKGETPEDKVIVFTYKAIVNKKDSSNNPLTGAEFTLYKKYGEEWKKVEKVVVKSEDGTTFTFTGLDDGVYKLEETVTPGEYNTMDPIEFKIEATHDELKDNPELKTLSGNKLNGEVLFTPNTTEGTLETDVINYKGSELPSTGGMGTTILYVAGAVMILAAGAFLVMQKKAEDK